MDCQKQKQEQGRSNTLILSRTIEDGGHSSSGYCRNSSESGIAVWKSFITKVSGMGIYLNTYRKRFLKTLLVSRFRKHLVILHKGIKGKQANPKISFTSDMSAKSMVKIWRKSNKVHGSKFWRELQNVQVEELKTPCLCELVAFHMNVKEKRPENSPLSGLFGEWKLQISEGKSSLFSSSGDIEVDLTCSICLETVFDPVALECGHIFCYMCACSAGSVTTVHGMKAAKPKSKCPLCRKEGVYQDAERMPQLHILLKRKLPEYWKERREKERQARVKEAKEYWELQCRAYIGFK